MTTSLEALLTRAEAVLARVETLLPPARPVPDWQAQAFRWQGTGLQSLPMPATMALSQLTGVEAQKAKLVRNTRQFVAGRSANNVLLTGARGTGKSSLIKALLPEFAADGLRLIEVDKSHLRDLPAIIECIIDRPERFIVFCDDLSFEEGEDSYKALKSILDGTLLRRCDHVLIYATSNRRHLMPERMRDNLETRNDDGEIHPGDTIEEKISLSERFGLWLSFYPFSQDNYLAAVHIWLDHFGLPHDALTERAALLWALTRGARSGRVAYQFACDWAGRLPEERQLDA